MKAFLFVVVVVGLFVAMTGTASAQCACGSPYVAAYQPQVTYYAPAAYNTYYAPTPAYTSYYAPAYSSYYAPAYAYRSTSGGYGYYAPRYYWGW